MVHAAQTGKKSASSEVAKVANTMKNQMLKILQKLHI
jgi:hypothetical protein